MTAGGVTALRPPGLGDDLEAPGGALAFGCLVIFTFVLFVAPQAIFPELEPLRVAWTSGALAVAAHLIGRAPGTPVTIVTSEVRLVLWIVLVGVLSIPLSYWPGGSWNFLLNTYIKSIVVFLLIANVACTPKRLRCLAAWMVGCAVLIAPSGVLAFSAGQFVEGSRRILGYMSGLAMNPNDFALTLNLVLPFALALLFATASIPLRLLLAGATVVMAAGVVVSFSRGGFMQLLTILVVVIARTVRRAGLAGLLAVVGLLAVGVFVLPAGYGERIHAIVDASLDPSGSSTARWEGMKQGFVLMLSHPLTGSGLGMSVVALAAGGHGWSPIHDVYLQIGADLGVLGFALFLCLIWVTLRGLRKALRRLDDAPGADGLRTLGEGIELSCYAFLVGAAFGPVAYHFYFYYLLGFAVAFQYIVRRVVPDADVVQDVA